MIELIFCIVAALVIIELLPVALILGLWLISVVFDVFQGKKGGNP